MLQLLPSCLTVLYIMYNFTCFVSATCRRTQAIVLNERTQTFGHTLMAMAKRIGPLTTLVQSTAAPFNATS